MILPKYKSLLFLISFLLLGFSQIIAQESDLDKKVRSFLERRQGNWRDMNVPSSDGQLLYNLIVENGYTKALEIGTSTGHSAIWIAWALSKTGGKLITIEIDEKRYHKAVANFEKAGLSDYVRTILGNAHTVVPDLDGPFDFVFSDADKNWYINYFKAIDSKLLPGGCFAAHNVRPPGRKGMPGTQKYLKYVMSLKNYETKVDNSGGGLAISTKKE